VTSLHLHDGRTPELRIVFRPLASGLPLGFFAFGLGMAVLGAEGVGWVKGEDVHAAGLLLAAYVFPLELLATIVAFLARDTMGATALGLFTTSWLAIGLATLNAQPGQTSYALGIFLLWFSLTIVLIAAAGITTKPLISIVMLIAVGRGVLSGIYELTGATGLERAAGWVSWVIALAALYGGLAFALEDSRGHEILPTFRHGTADAIEGGLDEQLEQVESRWASGDSSSCSRATRRPVPSDRAPVAARATCSP
jgi:succinate-acetate transporter protein